MKKIEAMQIAPQRTEFLCQYISKLLSDKQVVDGKIEIGSMKIGTEEMLIFDIRVPRLSIREVLNTGITAQQVDVLTEYLWSDLINHFLEAQDMGLSPYYSIRGEYGMGQTMDGVSVMNQMGSDLRIHFACKGKQFKEQIEKYDARLNEYVEKENGGPFKR